MTKKYVFVLEDNDDLRELFVHLLQEESYEVRAYSNATSFKESLKCQRPDVIIMDIMLPDGVHFPKFRPVKSIILDRAQRGY